MTSADRCRFCRVYALTVPVFAALVGAVFALQLNLDLGRFLGHTEQVLRLLFVSATRSLAPGVAGSALLVSLVVAAHPWALSELERELPPLLKRAALVALPGYVLAWVVIGLVGVAVSHVAFDVPWAAALPALRSAEARAWSAGVVASVADATLIGFLAWRYLGRLQAGNASLPAKLVLAWTFGTGVRVSLGLLVSMLLPN